MTLTARHNVDMSDEIPPPVNNACVPDIYNKLDASTIEKTKVINLQLKHRLQIQEKVLVKYRNAAEQRYTVERDKVRSELRNIFRRLPNYADIPHLETKVKKLRKGRKAKTTLKHDCVFTTEPLDMKGLSTEKGDKPFCDRFITHHLPSKTRYYQDILQTVKKGMSMPDIRPKPSDLYRRIPSIRTSSNSDDTLSPKLFPVIQSLDDNFVTSKSHFIYDDDDDDTNTV